MIDLLSIARTEADGGDLLGLLSGLFESSDVKPTGYSEAVVWQGGKHDGTVNPVAHSLTDAYALLGTIAAADVLGLPFYAVPMWSQYRHDTKLASLEADICRYNQVAGEINQVVIENVQELLKVQRDTTEKARISVRQARREFISDCKDLLKDKSITEDELKRAEQDIQKSTGCMSSSK